MSPVHVLVSQRPEDEQRYGSPFEGAVELYRFRSNVEAFERLTGATAPIDVLVITPEQDAIFNMTAEQLVERLVSSTLSMGGVLADLRIVVVGELRKQHPRVAAVADLDAAVRLVKFGTVEGAPKPATAANPVPELRLAPMERPLRREPAGAAPAPAASPVTSMSPVAPAGPGFADSVISAIWDDPERRAREARAAAQAEAAARAHAEAAHAQAAAAHMSQAQAQAQPVAGRVQPGRGMGMVRAGGPARHQGVVQLFAHPGGQAAAHRAAGAPAPHAHTTGHPVLQPVQAYALQSRGEYRGPSDRTALTYGAAGPIPGMPPHGVPGGPPPAMQPSGMAQHPGQMPQPQHGSQHGSQHGLQHQHSGMHVGSPLPPALGSQIRHMVYQQAPAGDPVLGWSAGVQRSLAAGRSPQQHASMQPHGAPQHPQAGPAPMPMPMPAPAAQHPGAGAPGMPVPVMYPHATPPASAGPLRSASSLLARAEREGDVSFG